MESENLQKNAVELKSLRRRKFAEGAAEITMGAALATAAFVLPYTFYNFVEIGLAISLAGIGISNVLVQQKRA